MPRRGFHSLRFRHADKRFWAWAGWSWLSTTSVKKSRKQSRTASGLAGHPSPSPQPPAGHSATSALAPCDPRRGGVLCSHSLRHYSSTSLVKAAGVLARTLTLPTCKLIQCTPPFRIWTCAMAGDCPPTSQYCGRVHGSMHRFVGFTSISCKNSTAC